MSERGGALDAILALGIRVASAGLVFGLQVLLARLMPVDGYGGFVTVWTWMLALGSFAALGFAESSIRFLPRYQLRRRQSAIRAYWRFGLFTVLGISSLATFVAVVLAIFVGAAEGAWLMVLLVALGLPFLAAEYFLEGVARSFGWFRLAAVPVYILRPLLIAGACLALYVGGVSLTLPVVGAVLIGSMGVVAAGLGLVMARRIRAMGSVTGGTRPGQKRLWILASLPLLAMSGLDDLTSYADILLLGLLAEPDDVAIYFAAARSLALAGFVAYAMTLVAGRRFALDLAGGPRSQLQSNLLEATRQTFWASVIAVAATLAAGPLLLSAFGPEFVSGQTAMAVLGLGMIVRSMAGQAGEMLIVAGRQKEGILVGLMVLAVSIGLGLILIPTQGIVGAAIAAAIAMSVRTAALAEMVWRVEGLRVVSLGLPRLSLR